MKHFWTTALLSLALPLAAIQLSATEATENVDLVILVSNTRHESNSHLTPRELERITLAEGARRLNRWVRSNSGEDGWTKVSADEGLLSLPFRYNGPKQLTLYTRVLQGEEPPMFVPREQISLPDQIKTGILFALRVSGTDENPSFRLGVIDCSTAPSDKMGVLLYNLTQSPIIASIGRNSEAVPLKPSVPEWNPLNQKRSAVPLRLAAFDEEWKLVYNSIDRLPLNRPTLGLILPGSPGQPTDVNIYLLAMPVWPSEERLIEEKG